MKANSWESDEYRQLYNESFQRNNNTSILWFGDNFEILPEVVEDIVKAVQKKLKVPDNIEDWSLLRSVRTPEDTLKNLLDKYSKDFEYLSDVFLTEDKVLAKKILKNVQQKLDFVNANIQPLFEGTSLNDELVFRRVWRRNRYKKGVGDPTSHPAESSILPL